MITQKELKKFYELKRKKDEFEAISDRIKDALRQNEEVEGGPWELKSSERSRPVVSWKERYVNIRGQAAANRILKKAKRTYYWVIDVTYDAVKGKKAS